MTASIMNHLSNLSAASLMSYFIASLFAIFTYILAGMAMIALTFCVIMIYVIYSEDGIRIREQDRLLREHENKRGKPGPEGV